MPHIYWPTIVWSLSILVIAIKYRIKSLVLPIVGGIILAVIRSWLNMWEFDLALILLFVSAIPSAFEVSRKDDSLKETKFKRDIDALVAFFIVYLMIDTVLRLSR